MNKIVFIFFMLSCVNLSAQWIGNHYPDYGPQFFNTYPNQITYVAPYLYVANNGSYIYRTSNSGELWDSIKINNFGSHSQFIEHKGSNIVFPNEHGLVKSTDNGITFFQRYESGRPIDYERKDYTEFILVDSHDKYLLFSNYENNYWDTIKPIPFGEPKQFFIYNSKNYLILKTNIGSNYYTNLYKADNFTGNINDFQKIGNGLPSDGTPQVKIINNRFYAVCGEKGIFVSNDFGLNFTPINDGLPTGNFQSNFYNEVIGIDDKLFTINYYKGVYYSYNNGINWVNVNANINNMRIYGQIGIDNNYLYCIAYDNNLPSNVKMYKRLLSDFTVGINPVISEIPSFYALEQNYPNPFNPTTKISFSIPKAEFVTVKVFDMTGKEAAVLVSQNMKSGTYEYTFNGSMLSSGIYFYQIITPSFTETKKMTLVK